VAEDLKERGSVKRHRFRSGLAEPNAVSLASSRQGNVVALLFDGEIVPLNYVPAHATR
jgi:hypothetical protein